MGYRIHASSFFIFFVLLTYFFFFFVVVRVFLFSLLPQSKTYDYFIFVNF